MIAENVISDNSVKNMTLSAVFDDFIVMTDYDTGRVSVIPAEEAHLVENRPLYKFFTGSLKLPECDGQTFRLHYGPVSSGIWEAGAFDILTYGERILGVLPLTHYKVRGLEEKVAGMHVKDAVRLVEKFCGTLSSTYSTAFCMATERATGIEVEDDVKLARIVAVELERIYNHVHSIYRLALAASQKVAVSHLSALEEDILRMNFRIFGHRYAFGFNGVGLAKIREKRVDVGRIRREFEELVDELSSSKIFIDRLHNTAKLSERDVFDLDSIGVTAKACGVVRDMRTFSELYSDFDFTACLEKDGDSLARTVVRFKEVIQSLEIVEMALDELSLSQPLPSYSDTDGEAMAFVESPPGDLLVYLKVSKGRVEKLRVRGASEVNFLAFAKGVEGNIFTDYPFALESFGLSFADAAR